MDQPANMINPHVAQPTEPTPERLDWRAEAEAAGRAAFERVVAELQPTPEPLAWLRKESR